MVSCSESLRRPASGVGRAEAAFEEACDVCRQAERLGALPEEVARGGPSGPGPSAKSVEPPGEIADGIGCPGRALGLGSVPRGASEDEREVGGRVVLDAELPETTPGELPAELARLECGAVEVKREPLNPLRSRGDVGGDAHPGRLESREEGREGGPALRRAADQGPELGGQERPAGGGSPCREAVLAGELSDRGEAFEAVLPVRNDGAVVANP